MTVFTSLLISNVSLQRPQRTADGQGGWLISYTDLPTVRGRIRPASSIEKEVAMSEERQISHVLYVHATANIQRGDVATIGNLVVDVEAIREPSKAGEHYECDCLERQQGA
jgi:SPP1 family predicted phage head-tail adaptor